MVDIVLIDKFSSCSGVKQGFGFDGFIFFVFFARDGNRDAYCVIIGLGY